MNCQYIDATSFCSIISDPHKLLPFLINNCNIFYAVIAFQEGNKLLFLAVFLDSRFRGNDKK
jgi:hypothetical protein